MPRPSISTLPLGADGLRPQLDHVADLHHDDVVIAHAQRAGQVGVVVQVPVLAVHGDEVPGLHQRMDQLQFLLPRVAGDVHLRQRLIDHVRADADQLVDDAGHRLFVAGDGVGGEDHHVAFTDLQLAVLGEGHAAEAAHGLALAAGGDDGDLIVRVAVQIVGGDQLALGDLQIPELGGDLGHVHHAPPDQADLPAVAYRGVHHRLDAVDVRGEHGDDHTARGPGHLLVEGVGHLLLGHGVALPLHVGGIAHQRQHALVADGRQASQVDGRVRQRGVVHLEVAGVHDGAHRGADRQRAGVGDGVVDVYELHREAAGPDHVSRLHDVERGHARQAVLLQLVLAQRQRQPGAVDRGGHVAHHVGHRADMVLVPVGDEIAPDFLVILLKIGGVRDHKIHARQVLRGEYRAHVDHDDVRTVLKYGHVLADFSQTAQRYDLQPCFPVVFFAQSAASFFDNFSL